jgi:hypothetical protein
MVTGYSGNGDDPGLFNAAIDDGNLILPDCVEITVGGLDVPQQNDGKSLSQTASI